MEGVKISREIFSQPSLRKHIAAVRYPDGDVRTQKDFEDYARQYGRTSYHPTCTCKMGVDEMAVVDPQLRVRGLDGIRICDSSIMPSLVGFQHQRGDNHDCREGERPDPREPVERIRFSDPLPTDVAGRHGAEAEGRDFEVDPTEPVPGARLMNRSPQVTVWLYAAHA